MMRCNMANIFLIFFYFFLRMLLIFFISMHKFLLFLICTYWNNQFMVEFVAITSFCIIRNTYILCFINFFSYFWGFNKSFHKYELTLFLDLPNFRGYIKIILYVIVTALHELLKWCEFIKIYSMNKKSWIQKAEFFLFL